MSNIDNLLDLLAQYMVDRGITRKKLAEEIGMPYATLKGWFYPAKTKRLPSAQSVKLIEKFLAQKEDEFVIIKEAKRQAEIVRGLLLALEDRLWWFRTSEVVGRDIFRNNLNAYDVGYIASLLTMLGEEDKFQRWLKLSGYEFKEFKAKG